MWMRAWSIFLRTFINMYPEMFSQLLAYQASIVSFVALYNFTKIYMYDKHFRTKMATYPNRRWDVPDDQLYAEFSRSAGPPNSPATSSAVSGSKYFCYYCGDTSHLCASCPKKGQSKTNAANTPALPSTATTTRCASDSRAFDGFR